MSEPKKSSRRPNPDYHWTGAKTKAFLFALAATGSVKAAAQHVGMSRHSAYRLRARLGPEFAEIWDRGLALRRMSGPHGKGDTFPLDSVKPTTSVSP